MVTTKNDDSERVLMSCYRCYSTYKVQNLNGKLVCSGFCLKQHLAAHKDESDNSTIENNKEKTKNEEKMADAAETKAWKIGDHCVAVFSEDKLEYEAVLKTLQTTEEGTEYGVVTYLGYGNEETQWIANLKPSAGESAIKAQIEASGGGEDVPETKAPAPVQEFKVGDFCRAVFADDGLEYEGKIISLESDENGAKYVSVEYLGYLNVEVKWVADLLPTKGEEARKKQEREALGGTEPQDSVAAVETVPIPDPVKEIIAEKQTDIVDGPKNEAEEEASVKMNELKITEQPIGIENKAPEKPKNLEVINWTSGDFCLASDPSDETIMREAMVLDINKDDEGNTYMEIKFVGTSDVVTAWASDLKKTAALTKTMNNPVAQSCGKTLQEPKVTPAKKEAIRSHTTSGGSPTSSNTIDDTEAWKTMAFNLKKTNEALSKANNELELKVKQLEKSIESGGDPKDSDVDKIVLDNMTKYNEKIKTLEDKDKKQVETIKALELKLKSIESKFVESVGHNTNLLKKIDGLKIELQESKALVCPNGAGDNGQSNSPMIPLKPLMNGLPIIAMLARDSDGGLTGYAMGIERSEMVRIYPMLQNSCKNCIQQPSDQNNNDNASAQISDQNNSDDNANAQMPSSRPVFVNQSEVTEVVSGGRTPLRRPKLACDEARRMYNRHMQSRTYN